MISAAGQTTFPCLKCLYEDEMLVNIIMKRLVAIVMCTVYGELNPVKAYTARSEGTIMIPPPTPNNPDNIPVAIPIATNISITSMVNYFDSRRLL